MEHELSEKVKKNLLDLQYNKYIQYYNTSIIILFTYFIGVAIAFVTRQININASSQFLVLGLISITVITIVILSMLYFKNNQKNILDEIKNLNI